MRAGALSPPTVRSLRFLPFRDLHGDFKLKSH